MSKAKLTICLLSLLALGLAGAPAQAAAGCCETKDDCFSVDTKDECTAAGGTVYYMTGFCNDQNKCEASAAGDPVKGPIAEPIRLLLSAGAEPLLCPVAAVR